MSKKIKAAQKEVVSNQAEEVIAADMEQAILEQAEAKLDAIEAQAQTGGEPIADADTAASVLTATDVKDEVEATAEEFDELYASFSADEKLEKAKMIAEAFDGRIKWLAENKPDNLSQPKKLENYRKKIALPSAAGVLLVTKTNEEFINRATNAGDGRYNIYAIDKAIDIINGLTNGQVENAINKAILKSMLNFQAAGIPFSGEYAKAACSKNIRISDKNADNLLVRHTVSPSTTSTQSSSTMSALRTLGIVENTGSPKFPVYRFANTPASKKLQQVLAAA